MDPSLRRHYRPRLSTLLLAALFVLVPFRAALAVPPKYFELAQPVVSRSTGVVSVALGISVDNLRGLFDMLKDGATLHLAIRARFERERTLLGNVVLSEREYVYVLRHNPLTREFAMFLPGENQPVLDRNLQRLLDATWSKFQAVFGPETMPDRLEPDQNYRAVLELTLQYAEVPPWLAKNFVFWSRNVVEPETVTAPFTP